MAEQNGGRAPHIRSASQAPPAAQEVFPSSLGGDELDLTGSISELETQLERFQSETRKKEAEMAALQRQFHEMKLIEQRQRQLHTQPHTMKAQPRVVVPVVVSKPQERHELDIDPRCMPRFHVEAEFDHTVLSPDEAVLVAKAKAWAAMYDDDDDISASQHPQQEYPPQRTSIRARSTVSPRHWQPVSYEERSEVQFSLSCACLRFHPLRTRLNDGQLNELRLAAFRPTSVPETFNSTPRDSGGVAICRSSPPPSPASCQVCS